MGTRHQRDKIVPTYNGNDVLSVSVSSDNTTVVHNVSITAYSPTIKRICHLQHVVKQHDNIRLVSKDDKHMHFIHLC